MPTVEIREQGKIDPRVKQISQKVVQKRTYIWLLFVVNDFQIRESWVSTWELHWLKDAEGVSEACVASKSRSSIIQKPKQMGWQVLLSGFHLLNLFQLSCELVRIVMSILTGRK